MKTKLFGPYRTLMLGLLSLFVALGMVLASADSGLADANAPTETNTPEPSATSAPTDTPVPPQPSDTPAPAAPTDDPNSLLAATLPPAPTPITGGLSLLNRILLVILAVTTVIVMALIAYAIYYRTRREDLEDR
jgi:hypothetical protein